MYIVFVFDITPCSDIVFIKFEFVYAHPETLCRRQLSPTADLPILTFIRSSQNTCQRDGFPSNIC